MVLTDREDLADVCVSLRNQGRSKYSKWLNHERLGYNFRLSDINCALGIMQLARIDEIKAKRQQVARWYQEMLADEGRLVVPIEPPGCELSWFVFVVRLAGEPSLKQRNQILDAMRDRGIQVGDYFPAVHLQPFIAEQFGYQQGDFPVAESVCKGTIALPFYNNLTKDEVAIVCRTLKEVLDENLPAR
jgi:perosamine synthetase